MMENSVTPPQKRIASNELITTDVELVDLLVHSLLVWTETAGYTFCYITDKGKFLDIDPVQAQRMRDAGMIELFPSEYPEKSFQWHLSRKGWDTAFSRKGARAV